MWGCKNCRLETLVHISIRKFDINWPNFVWLWSFGFIYNRVSSIPWCIGLLPSPNSSVEKNCWMWVCKNCRLEYLTKDRIFFYLIPEEVWLYLCYTLGNDFFNMNEPSSVNAYFDVQVFVENPWKSMQIWQSQ